MTELFVRYIHFISIFILCSMLVLEYLLLKPEMTLNEIRQFLRVDGLYGLSAMTTLAAGLTLWFIVGKPAVFYSSNWVFHLKVGIFIIIALLSIYPTFFFTRARRKTAASIVIPDRIKNIIRTALFAIVIMPLLAVFMARGFGL